ncbi:hypothetical protein CVU82_02060 [Candidatus Falkowbacteria bacterium HGW-Falkowbacteria-1]|uniref:Uncharacterized protein n=1 Tax=Candidatus Falkowbacteria bacterium HGW-Falkowbacteria-1 TaxID=2013768 RepID=A0A2N2E9F2_9BACT|nr:MAG: hypothetical protein CVU82_02060 [Candidatus Falkowbacteria bacterium HGW-Falkowbacteria-1]
MKNKWLFFWRAAFVVSSIFCVVVFFARQRTVGSQNEFNEIFNKTEFAGKNDFFVFQVKEILIDSLAKDFSGKKLEKNCWYFFRDSSMYPLKESTKEIIEFSRSEGISTSFEMPFTMHNISEQAIFNATILSIRNAKQL